MTGTPPVLKKVSCNLQDACDGVASVLTFAELLATASQSPKHLQSSLRRRRKRPFFCRVVCDGVASVLFFAEFFATASQASCFLQSSLRRRRKRLVFCRALCDGVASYSANCRKLFFAYIVLLTLIKHQIRKISRKFVPTNTNNNLINYNLSWTMLYFGLLNR